MYMKKVMVLVLILFLIMVPVQGLKAATVQIQTKSSPVVVYGSGKVIQCSNPSINIQDWAVKQIGTIKLPAIYVYKHGKWVKIVPSGHLTIPQPPGSIPEKETKPAPSPTPSPNPVPAPESGDFSALQKEMLGYINSERALAKVAPLTLDPKLCQVAEMKSRDMAEKGYFSHNSPTYGSPFEMMKNQGISYRMAGENIAKNTSVAGAHKAFMNSSGHKANILKSGYTKVGLGFYQEGRYLYITQLFTD
jgi:uncharacterized YkwD family protein